MDLKSIIPSIKNWPKEGVDFLDITPVLENPEAFAHCTKWLVEEIKRSNATSLIAVESRGFPFAAAAAAIAQIPLILARKPGKLPGDVYTQTYDTEYSTDAVELKQTAPVGLRPMIIDDLLATGGTIHAVSLLLKQNFTVTDIFAAVIINLQFLPGSVVLESNHITLSALETYE